jgi:hypothetical protein
LPFSCRPTGKAGREARLSALSPASLSAKEPITDQSSLKAGIEGLAAGAENVISMEGIDAPKQVPTAAGGVSGPQPRQHSSGLPSIPYSGVSPGSLAPMTYDQLIQSDFGQQPGMLWMPVFLPPPQADSDPGASGLKPFQQSPVASLNSWPRPEQNVGSEASTARGGSFLPSPDKRGMEQLSLSPPVKGEMSPKKKGKVEDRSSAQVQFCLLPTWIHY